jgi:hypothetical protein
MRPGTHCHAQPTPVHTHAALSRLWLRPGGAAQSAHSSSFVSFWPFVHEMLYCLRAGGGRGRWSTSPRCRHTAGVQLHRLSGRCGISRTSTRTAICILSVLAFGGCMLCSRSSWPACRRAQIHLGMSSTAGSVPWLSIAWCTQTCTPLLVCTHVGFFGGARFRGVA